MIDGKGCARAWRAVVIMAALVAAVGVMPAVAASAPTVEPELVQQIDANPSTGYLIYFRDKADLSKAYTMAWRERGEFVYQELSRVAKASQQDVRSYLDAQGAKYKAYWIANVISVQQSNFNTFQGLQTFPEIEAIKAHRKPSLIEPVKEVNNQPAAIEPNISHVNADDVWAMGFTGTGVVVANIDTGVRYSHQALVGHYRGNLGGGSYNHNYNWFDPDNLTTSPADGHGHGTHTMGTIVGDDGGANQIGMAPGAKWIACAGCPNGGCTDTALLGCAEFMAAPTDLAGNNPDTTKRPNVVNNSWGDCGTSYDNWYQTVVDSWHAAGIVPVFSNGNASNCGYSSPPGCNTVGNPGRYGNVLGVGSTGQSNGQYATHSNWGPTDNPWNDNPLGYPTIKPNVAAPGVNIRSSVPTSDTSYEGGWSGTSMSAPHVTGLVALMYNACPAIIGNYSETARILMEEAYQINYNSACGGEGPGNIPNNATGWGEIDALATIQEVLAICGPTGTLNGTVTLQDGTPLAGVLVTAEKASPAVTKTATTDGSGAYTMTFVPTGEYSVTAALFGYAHDADDTPYPKVATVNESATTTVPPIWMEPFGSTTIDGYVTDKGHGYPLYASIHVADMGGTFETTIYNDPFNGYFEIVLPHGYDYIFTVNAAFPGYNPMVRTITVGPIGTTEYFVLSPISPACTVAGYGPPAGSGIVEGFEGTFPPAGWTTTYSGCDSWLSTSTTGRGNFTGGSGYAADADSDWCGSAMTTDLYSPVMNLSSFNAVGFEFKYDFNDYGGSDTGYAAVSADGGSSWTTVKAWDRADDRGPKTFSVDATSILCPGGTCTNQARIRFNYTAPGWDWWFQVDDVKVFDPAVPCSVLPGTLAAGFVNDENTGDPILGATVHHDAGYSTMTVATPADPILGDGFYMLFTPLGPGVTGPSTRTFTASKTGYADDVDTRNVVPNTVNHIDFTLGAGWLELAPTLLKAFLYPTENEHQDLSVINHGSLSADFKLVATEKPVIWNTWLPAFVNERPDVDPESQPKSSMGRAPKPPVMSDKVAYPKLGAPLAGTPAFGMDAYPGENLVTWPDASIPGTWTVIANEAASQYFAGDFLGGDFSKLYVIDYGLNQLHTLDTATGAVTVIGPASPSAGGNWSGMTGSVDGTLYASSAICGTASYLYTVDPATGATTVVGQITNGACIIDIAINAEGDMYGVDIVSDSLVKIDPATGAGTVIGPLGVDANYAQGMDFDEDSGTLYWAAYTSSGELRTIDLATGNSFLVGAFPGGAEVDAFAIATGGASTLPWLILTPTEGTVGGNTTFPADAEFIADGTDHFGLHRATIKAVHNTPYTVNTVDACMTRAFYDVPEGTWADTHIHALAGTRIVGSYDEFGYFRPDENMTRGAMARWLLRAKYGPDYSPSPCEGLFADVPCELTPNADYIEDLYREGITGGCGTSPLRYCPNDPVQRKHMAVFLLRTLEGSTYTPPACSGVFDDVPCPAYTYDNWIEDLYNRGITGGCSTSPMLFCPDAFATRAQMAVFVNKTFSIPTTCAP